MSDIRIIRGRIYFDGEHVANTVQHRKETVGAMHARRFEEWLEENSTAVHPRIQPATSYRNFGEL